jgi:hypothetical protein
MKSFFCSKATLIRLKRHYIALLNLKIEQPFSGLITLPIAFLIHIENLPLNGGGYRYIIASLTH